MPYRRVKSHTKKVLGRRVRVRSYIKRIPRVRKTRISRRRYR